MGVSSVLATLKNTEVSKTILWCVAFTGVCVLVGLGKIKPETIEYLLFALGGAIASGKGSKSNAQ